MTTTATKTELTPLDNLICYLAAWGLKNTQIEIQAKCSNKHIYNVLSTQLGQDRVKEIQKETFGSNPKAWIEKILPEAIQTAIDIMNNPEAKLSVRLQAAESFMDRALGKAQQNLKVEDTTLRQVIEKLDRIEQMRKVGEIPKDIVDAEFTPVEDNKGKGDEVDKWISEEYATEKNSQTATNSSA